MWSEAFMSIGQSVLYQIRPDVLVQVLQRVRNNRRAEPAQADFRKMTDGIQYEFEWLESGFTEKTDERRAYVFGLVAEKCQSQVKVLHGNDASGYLFLQNGNPVDGMPVG